MHEASRPHIVICPSSTSAVIYSFRRSGSDFVMIVSLLMSKEKGQNDCTRDKVLEISPAKI